MCPCICPQVEVGEKTDWDLGVASHSVNRKGKITASPANGYWFLSLRDRTEYVFRTDPATNLSVNIRPSRIGIYLDCDKGMVSFYNAEAKVLIYTYSDSFPDTIHPFFSPCTNMSGQNEAPLVVCPLTITHWRKTTFLYLWNTNIFHVCSEATDDFNSSNVRHLTTDQICKCQCLSGILNSFVEVYLESAVIKTGLTEKKHKILYHPSLKIEFKKSCTGIIWSFKYFVCLHFVEN